MNEPRSTAPLVEQSRWKLGLFLALGLVAAFAGAILLGASEFRRETMAAVTYFADESLNGLDVGSAVKLRGVPVGRVAGIRAGGLDEHLEVGLELFVDDLARLGLDVGGLDPDQPQVSPRLRAQLTSSGLTGLKFIDLIVLKDRVSQGDAADGVAAARARFGPPRGTIFVPATPSTLRSLEDALAELREELPALGRELRETFSAVTDLVRKADNSELLGQGRNLIERVDLLARDMQGLVKRVDGAIVDLDVKGLRGSLQEVIGGARELITGVEALVSRMQQQEGPLAETLARLNGLLDELHGTVRAAELPAATRSLRDAGGKLGVAVDGLADEFQVTLENLRETSDALRELVDMLRRDPSSALFGRTYADPRPEKP